MLGLIFHALHPFSHSHAEAPPQQSAAQTWLEADANRRNWLFTNLNNEYKAAKEEKENAGWIKRDPDKTSFGHLAVEIEEYAALTGLNLSKQDTSNPIAHFRDLIMRVKCKDLQDPEKIKRCEEVRSALFDKINAARNQSRLNS